MGKGDAKKEGNISADPLFKRLGRGGAVAFAKKINSSEQRVANWKRRGIPSRALPHVAAAIGLSVEQYLQEAGYPGVQGIEEPRIQYTLELDALKDDFLALPDGLREYVARKTAQLRAYADALPQFIRDALKPPVDPERYLAWERDIEADMMMKRQGAITPPPPAPGTPSRIGRVYGKDAASKPGATRARKRT